MIVKFLRNGTDGASTAYDAGAVANVDSIWAGRILEFQDKSNPMIAESNQAELDAYEASQKSAEKPAKK